MWFKRKPKNRRLGREQVLDVKLRSSQVRATRARLVAAALGTTCAMVFGAYVLYRVGGWMLDRLIYENQAFAIRQVDVQTDGVISVDQLRRWAGVRPGENLLALDLARVKRDLEMIPLIQFVSVERILPHTLRVLITEREPIAQVNVLRRRSDGGVEVAVCHLDAQGYVMMPLDPRQREIPPNPLEDTLPVIGGVNASELRPGCRVDTPQVQAALHLIGAFAESPMAGLVDFKRVDVSAPEVLVVTTGQGSQVTFALTDPEQQLRRWHAIFERGQQSSNSIASLDLAVTNNVPLRWLEASAPVAPKPAKLSRPKKKHV